MTRDPPNRCSSPPVGTPTAWGGRGAPAVAAPRPRDPTWGFRGKVRARAGLGEASPPRSHQGAAGARSRPGVAGAGVGSRTPRGGHGIPGGVTRDPRRGAGAAAVPGDGRRASDSAVSFLPRLAPGPAAPGPPARPVPGPTGPPQAPPAALASARCSGLCPTDNARHRASAPAPLHPLPLALPRSAAGRGTGPGTHRVLRHLRRGHREPPSAPLGLPALCGARRAPHGARRALGTAGWGHGVCGGCSPHPPHQHPNCGAPVPHSTQPARSPWSPYIPEPCGSLWNPDLPCHGSGLGSPLLHQNPRPAQHGARTPPAIPARSLGPFLQPSSRPTPSMGHRWDPSCNPGWSQSIPNHPQHGTAPSRSGYDPYGLPVDPVHPKPPTEHGWDPSGGSLWGPYIPNHPQSTAGTPPTACAPLAPYGARAPHPTAPPTPTSPADNPGGTPGCPPSPATLPLTPTPPSQPQGHPEVTPHLPLGCLGRPCPRSACGRPGCETPMPESRSPP